MKDIFKYFGLLFVGLIMAVIVYPILHEAGHSVLAILVGAKVVRFHLLPMPFVLCEVSNVNIMGQIVIGLGGIMIPYMLSMTLRPREFWSWYASLVLKGISEYSIILSILAIVLHMNGSSWQNEDIVQVLRIFPQGKWLFLIVLCIMGTYGFIRLIKENSITRCIDYFDNPQKQCKKKEQSL